jgi:ABC-type glycerol-3-phosphate transport system substrate-binding protein
MKGERRIAAAIAMGVALLLAAALPVVATGTEEADHPMVEVEWLRGAGGEINPDIDEVWEEHVESVIPNLDIDLVISSQRDLRDQYQLMFASGDLPTTMNLHFNLATFVDYALQDVFVPLNDYWSSAHYPNLVGEFTDDALEVGGMVDGTIYGIYRWTQPVELMCGIRKDWLDAVGLDVPTNLEELTEVARAFTFDDPDGNGEDDTYGLAVDKWNAKPLQWMNGTFHVNYCDSYHFVNAPEGSEYPYVEPSIYQPGMFEYVKYMRDRYQEGVVIPEGPVLGGGAINREYWQTGRLGIFGVNGAAAVPPELEGKVVVAPPIEGPYGPASIPLRNPVLQAHVINKGVADEAQVQKVLEIWDWMMTEDGFVYNACGPEGMTWSERRADGSPIVDRDAWRDAGWTAFSNMPQPLSSKWVDVSPWLWGTPEGEQLVSDLDTWKEHGVEIYTEMTAQRPEIYDRVGEIFPSPTWTTATKIMTGELPLSAWEEMIEEIDERLMGEVTRAMNDLLAETLE